jgi:hypothetical protein
MAEADVRSIQIQPLDIPLIVADDTLGVVIDITPGGWPCQLHLPVLGNAGAVTGPPLVRNLNVAGLFHDEVWGASFWDKVERRAIHGVVLSCHFETQAVPDDAGTSGWLGAAGLTELAAELGEWFPRWVQWCAVMSSQPSEITNPGRAAPSPRRNMVGRWLILDNEHYVLQSTPITLSGMAMGLDKSGTAERAVNLAVVEYAAARADAREDVPLLLELRRNAHVAARAWNWRVAVAEVGTAAEGWLSQLLRLSAGHRQTLGMLVVEARRRGLGLPADADAALVQVRNDVIHRGHSPAGMAVTRAVEIGEELWALADPGPHRLVRGLRRVDRPQRQEFVIFRPGDEPEGG